MYVRRAPFVLALALAVAPVARAAAAQPAPPPVSGSGTGNQWAVLVGMEDGYSDTGLQLRGDLEFAQRPLSSQIGFSIVASLGYTHFSRTYTDFTTGDHVDASLDLVKLVPAARFSLVAHPFRFYADAGLGLYYGDAGAKYRDVFGNVLASGSDSSIGVMMRVAVGAQVRVSPGFSLGAELGFSPYFATVPDDTFTSLLLSASFRM